MSTIKTLLFAVILFALAGSVNAQSVGINADGSAPNGSAMLDVNSTTKGFLAPRLTAAQKAVISSPATGLLVYQTDGAEGFYYYTGSAWTMVGTSSTNGTVTGVSTGTGLTGGTINTSGTISLANTTVTPGGYTRATITVDAQGRITAAGDGAAINLTTGVTGTLPVANGGTGSATQNFVDLTTTQTAAGNKTFSGNTSLGGTLGVTGDVAVNTNKFNVTAVSGNTSIAGTLGVGGTVSINAEGSAPNGSAMLDVSSTSSGFLPPRMTYTQRNSISTPVAGLMIWCNNCGSSGELQVYNGTTWKNLTLGIASGFVPDAPTIGTATAGGQQASVTFTQPAFDGGLPITSYTVTSSPGGFTGTVNQAGSGTITITGLTNGTAYTFTVKAYNAAGAGAASDASNRVFPYAVGTSYLGGKLAYVYQPSDPGYVEGEIHGLIAAVSDFGSALAWDNGVNEILRTGTALGTGYDNTAIIIEKNGNTASYAAKECADYTNTETGTGSFSDWYLPSKNELNKLYLNRVAIGGFAVANYWSSTSSIFDSGYAWGQSFTNGEAFESMRFMNAFKVRAIRYF